MTLGNVFDRSAETYSEQINKSLHQFGVDHDFFTRHKAWLIGEVLARTGRDASSMALLDVGCGVANIHDLLMGRFRSIAGVDVSAESIRVAAQTHPDIEYKTYDGLHLPYDDAHFDIAIAICVFHHVPPADWQQLAGEMMRVVRERGTVIIIEHNPYNPLTRYIVATHPFDKDAVLLSPSRLRSLFTAAGAQSVSTRAVLNLPPKSDALKRLDFAVGRLPIGAQYVMTGEKP